MCFFFFTSIFCGWIGFPCLISSTAAVYSCPVHDDVIQSVPKHSSEGKQCKVTFARSSPFVLWLTRPIVASLVLAVSLLDFVGIGFHATRPCVLAAPAAAAADADDFLPRSPLIDGFLPCFHAASFYHTTQGVWYEGRQVPVRAKPGDSATPAPGFRSPRRCCQRRRPVAGARVEPEQTR